MKIDRLTETQFREDLEQQVFKILVSAKLPVSSKDGVTVQANGSCTVYFEDTVDLKVLSSTIASISVSDGPFTMKPFGDEMTFMCQLKM